MDVDGKGLRILEKVTDPAQLITKYTVGSYTFRSREKRRYFLKHNDTEAIKNGEGPNKLASCPYYCTASVTEDGDICLTYALIFPCVVI